MEETEKRKLKKGETWYEKKNNTYIIYGNDVYV